MSEREYEEGHIGTCENCHKEKVMVRPIMALDRFEGQNRGYYQICFECFKPRVKTKIHGKTVESPTLNFSVSKQKSEGLKK